MNRERKVEAKSPVDKKVVLFGKTGDGKSTLANALVTGGIQPEMFRTSNAARGCTGSIQEGTGRGWTVIDTIGLGESETGAIPHEKATESLTDFLKEFNDQYSHIIYVKNARGKITNLDLLIWLLFTGIFKGAEDAFVVVFTGVNEKWLEDNRDALPDYLKNQKLLVADIPPVEHRSAIIETRRKAVREKSIKNLEENLVKLFDERKNVYCSPEIAKMTPEQLEQKSRSLIRWIVDTIKKLFDETQWRSVARKLGSLINVADFIMNIVSLA